jgi:hypothetical protein
LVSGFVLHRFRIVLIFLVFELLVVLFLVVLTILSALVVSFILEGTCTVFSHALLAHVVTGTALPRQHHLRIVLRVHIFYVV